MKKLFTLFTIAFIVTAWTTSDAQTWDLQGCNDQTKQGITRTAAFVTYSAVAADGSYYVSFIDDMSGTNNLNDLKVHVKKWNGTTWQDLGGASVEVPNNDFFPIACDNNDLYLAYAETGGAPYDGKLSVKKYNTTTHNWDFVGSRAFSAGAAGSMSITTRNGKIYVAYSDATQNDKLMVKVFNTGNAAQGWQTVGTGVISAGEIANIVSAGTNIQVNNDNNIFVSYMDLSFNSGTGGVVVKKFDGTTWATVGNTTVSGMIPGYMARLAVDNNNKPYLSYIDPISMRMVVRTTTNNQWTTLPNATPVNIAFASSLITVNNVPHLAYSYDNTGGSGTPQAYVVKWNSNTNTWDAVGSNAVSQCQANGDVIDASLNADNNGKLYLTYHSVSTEVYVRKYNSGSTTPVTFTSLTANGYNSNALVSWSTSNEVNNHHFEIQHSTNGLDFTTIGMIAAQTGNNTTKQYQFTAYNLFNGKHYFRLKQVDKDGAYTYSTIVSVDLTDQSTLSLYPNPVTDKLTIRYKGHYQTALITDISGKTIATIQLNGNQTTVDVSRLAKGTYTLMLQGSDKSVTHLFIK